MPISNVHEDGRRGADTKDGVAGLFPIFLVQTALQALKSSSRQEVNPTWCSGPESHASYIYKTVSILL